MPKDLGSFYGRTKGQKVSLLGEFSLISGLKKLFAVCTTVVQLGILQLSERTPLKVS